MGLKVYGRKQPKKNMVTVRMKADPVEAEVAEMDADDERTDLEFSDDEPVEAE